MRCNSSVTLLVALVCQVDLAADKPAPSKPVPSLQDDLEALQGTWERVSARAADKDSPPTLRLAFHQDWLALQYHSDKGEENRPLLFQAAGGGNQTGR